MVPIGFLPFRSWSRRDHYKGPFKRWINGMKANGRNSNGQFAKGRPGGPGRPPRDVEKDYLAALTHAVTPDKWRSIVQRALTDAEAGDRFARDWLSKHLIADNTR